MNQKLTSFTDAEAQFQNSSTLINKQQSKTVHGPIFPLEQNKSSMKEHTILCLKLSL